VGWAGVEWLQKGKPSALGAISGAVAGLVAITPAAGFVAPMPALVIGLIAGIVCYFMVTAVKVRLGYDDSLDAFGIHGAALLTGVFASSAVNPIFGGANSVGLLEGNGRQLVNQFLGVLIAWGVAIVGTLIILKVTDILVGLRVPKEAEAQGLDLSQHGEVGYDFEAS
jgi:Amt family ammonium transporter